MPETSPVTQGTSGPADGTAFNAAQSQPVWAPSAVVNDEVLIEVAPDRPHGRIHVNLVHTGRTQPIPAEDPWAA